MIHLDTNFLILALQPGTAEESQFRAWLQSGEAVGISSLAWAEFFCGPLGADEQALVRALFPNVEPLLAVDAERGAELFNLTGRRARSLADCLIAAVAMRCGARVATGNRADFQPMTAHGLQLA
jgi:predicted nucleic acid-binding protein